jgi:WD40 repeat protein
MKAPLVIPALLILALSAACKEESKTASSGTSTPSPPSARATNSPPSQFTVTPTVRSKLAPENVLELKVEAQGTLANIEGLSWSTDSNQLLAFTRQTIAAVDNKEGGQLKQITSVTAPEEIMDVAGSSFVTRLSPNQFNLRRIDNGSIIKTVQTETQFSNVALSRDGAMAAVQRLDKIAADLYQASSGNFVKQLSGFETAAPAYSVSFTPDSKYLIWRARAQVQFQDIATGAFGPQLRHEDFVSGVAFRPTGDAIATGSGKAVSIWEPGGGANQQTLEHDGIVSSVAYAPDGSLLAVASDAGITLWDARDATAYKRLDTKPGATWLVNFAPDGTSIGATNENGQASIWTRQGPTK